MTISSMVMTIVFLLNFDLQFNLWFPVDNLFVTGHYSVETWWPSMRRDDPSVLHVLKTSVDTWLMPEFHFPSRSKWSPGLGLAPSIFWLEMNLWVSVNFGWWGDHNSGGYSFCRPNCIHPLLACWYKEERKFWNKLNNCQ